MGLFWIVLFWVTKKKVQMQTGSRESFSKEGENFHVHFVANYSLCSTRSSVCSQSFPLHMSSYCFWMAENCCVSRRNILYNVGNGLLVFVVQCYPPSFLSQVSIFLTSHSHVHWVPFKNAITRAFSQPTTIYHLKRMVAHACIFILTW